MKMVEVFNKTGDKILACSCDLAYYASNGWKPAKVRATKKQEQE